MNVKEVLDASPPYLLACMAGVCFVLAIMLAWKQKLRSASLLSSLFVVVVLLAYFPQLDSLKAFMIDVKLRHSLDRADEILTRLRTLSVVNARLGYTMMTWGNRLDTPKASEKQRLLDAFDEQLISMNVGADERQEIRRPYVTFIAFDFLHLFVSTIDYALSRRQEALSLKMQQQPSDENRNALQNFVKLESDWRSENLSFPVEVIPLDDFKKYIEERVPTNAFSESETENLRKEANTISDLFYASNRKGGYTGAAAAYYDEYASDGMGAVLYRKIFEETHP